MILKLEMTFNFRNFIYSFARELVEKNQIP